MLLSDYLRIGYKLDDGGIFDPVLDEDSHFFINLQRLKKTAIPEFKGSYGKIHEYFRKIIKLLDKAENKEKTDTFYKQALKLFDFSEINGICLGYAKGTSGAGFGAVLGSQVISTAFDIVKAGVMDPEFFELLPLFQENVGADRLSDMIATLILDDIKEFTRRVNRELGINHNRYKKLFFNGDFLINPYKHDDVLLVPIDILHKLPVAESWEDIDLVVSQNSILRAEMNVEVASEWQKYTAAKRKDYLRRDVFKNPDACKRVIESYRAEELDAFDPRKDFQYFLTKLWQRIENLNIDWKTEKKAVDSFTAAHDILAFFKQWVEHNKGWEVIHYRTGRPGSITSEPNTKTHPDLCEMLLVKATDLYNWGYVQYALPVAITLLAKCSCKSSDGRQIVHMIRSIDGHLTVELNWRQRIMFRVVRFSPVLFDMISIVTGRRRP